jgi:hypothetical protein
MGEEIMFDVEKQIGQWRDDLSASENLAAADVGELETHLREEVSHLRDAGLSDAEAFLVARHRLGDAAALEMEFAKINTGTRLAIRLQWLAAGALLYILVGHFSSTVASALVWLGFDCGLTSIAGLAVVGGAVHIAAAAAAILFAFWVYTHFWRPRAARTVSKSMVIFALVVQGLAIAVMYATQALSAMLVAKSLGMQALGSIATANTCQGVVWMLLAPTLLMAWLGSHYLRKAPKANA